MAPHDFWRGFGIAIIMIDVVLIFDINVYPCVLISTIILFTLLHNFLTSLRDKMHQQHEFQRVEELAKAAYPNNGQISIYTYEIRQYVRANGTKSDWIAGVDSKDTNNEIMVLIQTRTGMLTKEKALAELHKMLAVNLVRKATV